MLQFSNANTKYFNPHSTLYEILIIPQHLGKGINNVEGNIRQFIDNALYMSNNCIYSTEKSEGGITVW